MNVQDLLKNAKDLTDVEFERRLNKLVRENYRYRNLNGDNRKLVMEILDDYKDRLRSGMGVSYNKRTRDLYKLKSKREKLGLTKEDIRDITEIVNAFK